MLAPWVVEEMKTAALKDKRLNRRLMAVLSSFSGLPTASIPAACGGRADMAGAYRLFDNGKVKFENVLQPHLDATRDRLAAVSTVLLVQDTTEVDLTRPLQQVQGAGLLDGSARYGALLHLLHGFTPDGTPLGTVWAKAWTRSDQPLDEASKNKKRVTLAQTPIEEKESYRWLEAVKRCGELQSSCPATHFIMVADSEADIHEVLSESVAQQDSLDWIVRSGSERTLELESSDGSRVCLRDFLLQQPERFGHTIAVRGRKAKVSCETRGRKQPRQSRQAEVVVRAGIVTLHAPKRRDRKLEELTIHAVIVSEVNPPADDEPVEWILLTSLPIDTDEAIRQVIQYYCTRWMIEVFFRVLKSGCRVEERRFEHIDRLLPCLAVYLTVAWRTLYVCRLGRGNPELDCEAVFEPSEWRSVWQIVKREKAPATPPKLEVFIRILAQLGGYVDHPKADPPGPQTVWLGLQRMHDIANCWDTFGPGATSNPRGIASQ